MKGRHKYFLFFAALVLIIVSGCAKPKIRCASPEDNPAHHYLRGMELLEASDLTGARAKFERSLLCDEKFSPSYGGLAIVDGLDGAAAGGAGEKLADSAYRGLKKAGKLSKTPEEVFAWRLARMRVNTALKPGKWLKKVERDFNKAAKIKVDEKKLIYYRDSGAAPYFMGLAYLEGGEFEQARIRFNDVLKAGATGKWNGPADLGWKKADRALRSLGGMTVGEIAKEMVLKDSVTRGELAAILADELRIERLFSGRLSSKKARKPPAFVPYDIEDNPFKEEILTVIGFGIRGLEPLYDSTRKAYRFSPDGLVSRKEFAFVVEDILINITGDEGLATAFVGHRESPFPDVSPTAPWYNAVMNAVTRDIMETGVSGEFRPEDNVDGPDLLLAIRVLRQRLNIN
ncbi:MAG: S-layer homology domain-containing protein [Thermodesulfobacteriota bacterium]|nr:MAG: S-layer homology domain-containing protein [Thermodesulfobacteriota bacterium]